MIIGISIDQYEMTTIFFQSLENQNTLIIGRYHEFVNGFRNKSVIKLKKYQIIANILSFQTKGFEYSFQLYLTRRNRVKKKRDKCL